MKFESVGAAVLPVALFLVAGLGSARACTVEDSGGRTYWCCGGAHAPRCPVIQEHSNPDVAVERLQHLVAADLSRPGQLFGAKEEDLRPPEQQSESGICPTLLRSWGIRLNS